MGEILPDGSIQSHYGGICQRCKKGIQVNMQGSETGSHRCIIDFESVMRESTCVKRVTICEIYDEQENLLVRESNRCEPKDGICQRLGVTQNKDNYDTESTCNWTHAEINAINHLKEGDKPYKSIIYGHYFYCDRCENLLRGIGCKELLIMTFP